MYEWLQDYQNKKNEIEYLEFNLERSTKELKRWVYGDLQDVKLNERSIASGLEERIEAMEYELAHKLNDLYDVEKLIRTFEGLDNKILVMKHIDHLTLERIAERLNYSTSHIKKRHAELVRTIKFVEKYH